MSIFSLLFFWVDPTSTALASPNYIHARIALL